MADNDSPKTSRTRRRQANVVGRRRYRRAVWLTLSEASQLQALAEAQGVTVPRLLVESALAEQGETPSRRREALARVFALQRTLTGLATNVNQLARVGNTEGRLPVGTAEALGEIRTAVNRLNGVLEELSGR